ncbi:hypothetical protein, conserved [Angomonas deanei]|uniref:Uncharacterized protein n=1 Tax=Angomonas deanei TaxID=59799 RepID=A0A7G2CMP7_9TRYP|nr:hypothetical protein, conserved [Angomonas deanei]
MTDGEIDDTFIGGVYNVYEGRILVGPLINVETFISKAEGSKFVDIALPPVSSRCVISCLPLAEPTKVEVPSGANQTNPGPSNPGADTTRPGTQSASDFIAKLKEKRNSLTLNRGQTHTRPPTEAELLRDANVKKVSEDNFKLKELADKVLGEGHFFSCTLSAENAKDDGVKAGLDFIRKCLESDDASVVYIYSETGRNRASCLAMHYLQEEKKVSVSDLTKRLPLGTPYIRHMVSFIVNDDTAADSFNADSYFFSYFCRRYSNLKESDIRAAMLTCPQEYIKIDRILNEQTVFLASSEKKF